MAQSGCLLAGVTYKISLPTIDFVAKSARRAAGIVLIVVTCISMLVPGQIVPDGALRIYAVNVVKTSPFEKPFTGYGIYLGKGAVITAAHVIGRW